MKKSQRSIEVRELFFLQQELSTMHATATAPQLDGVLQVEHFVKDDVIDGISGYRGMIEDAADYDGIVSRIIMPKTMTRAILAPWVGRHWSVFWRERAPDRERREGVWISPSRIRL